MNGRIDNGRIDGMRVGRVAYGRGVFATRRYRKGQVVAAITGTVIDDPNYSSDLCIDLGGPLSLEPDPPVRYLNHCCMPNCEVWLASPGRRNGTAAPRVVLEALRTIRPGDQLTIDYAWPAEHAIPCECGSPRCRGWIVAADEACRLPAETPIRVST